MVRQRAKERACEQAIKKTLAYRATFKYPLSFHQLTTFLITNKNFSYNFFRKTLRKLAKNKSIRVKKGKYYLPSIKPVSWNFRMDASQKIMHRNQYVFAALSKIPWIKMMGVTGSVGAYNATKDDDIDLFIVTEKDRLWISRLFVFLTLKVLNKYPTKETDRGKICPNILVDEKNLKWPKKQQNIYTANEIATLQPIYDSDLTYFKFIKTNSWIFKHLKNFEISFPEKFGEPKKRSEIIDRLEKVAMKSQLRYMEKRKTSEITKRGFVHFNVSDSSVDTLKNYRELLKSLDLNVKQRPQN